LTGTVNQTKSPPKSLRGMLRVSDSPIKRHKRNRTESKELSTEVCHTKVVTLSYEDLKTGVDLTQQIEEAFGSEGLGLLAVVGVPDLSTMRPRLLKLCHTVASLPEDIKAKYEHKESFYSVGWSHGKEHTQGKPDFAKGSWYANPLCDKPVDDEALIKKWPSFLQPNLWPQEVPDLKEAFMSLGKTMVDVGMLVADQCDAFVAARLKLPPEQQHRLSTILRASRVPKGRLLHYFDKTEEELSKSKKETQNGHIDFSSWCGWHNDHGSLTALCPAIYVDKKSGEVIPSPDPTAGLYIRSRQGKLIKPSMPKGALLYQIGETAQIHSGGLLQATPHAVKGANVSGVSRETFAVFMEPEWNEAMTLPQGASSDIVEQPTTEQFLPRGVPPLSMRWGTDKCPFTTCNFGDFSKETFACYYNEGKELNKAMSSSSS